MNHPFWDTPISRNLHFSQCFLQEWTSPNYWGYNLQQIFEGDVKQIPKKGHQSQPLYFHKSKSTDFHFDLRLTHRQGAACSGGASSLATSLTSSSAWPVVPWGNRVVTMGTAWGSWPVNNGGKKHGKTIGIWLADWLIDWFTDWLNDGLMGNSSPNHWWSWNPQQLSDIMIKSYDVIGIIMINDYIRLLMRYSNAIRNNDMDKYGDKDG